ncbi:MAG: hypothetical protein JRH20_00485 [Deltaproteobacteria bacterium]|nr:hypothetical protein [Deltaproteobacteria bacterium]
MVVLFVLAIETSLVWAQAQNVAVGAASQPIPHRLAVRVVPPHFRLGRGQAFDEGQLLTALSTRLARWKLKVVRASEAAGPGAIWRLSVRVQRGARRRKRARALTISFHDPDGGEVMLRRVPLRRYRPYDLAQTISLSTLESLVAVLDPVKFPGLVPPEQLPPSSATRPTTRPASLPQAERPIPTPSQPSSPTRWALALESAGGVVVPGDGWLGGLGFNTRFQGRGWMTQLAFNGWTPLSTSGDGYDLAVQLWTLYLGGGVRHQVKRWVFGATLGAALRLDVDSREGARVVQGDHIRMAGGFGGRLQLGLALTDSLSIESFLYIISTFPHASYTLNGEGILEVGGVLAGGGLGLVLSL